MRHGQVWCPRFGPRVRLVQLRRRLANIGILVVKYLGRVLRGGGQGSVPRGQLRRNEPLVFVPFAHSPALARLAPPRARARVDLLQVALVSKQLHDRLERLFRELEHFDDDDRHGNRPVEAAQHLQLVALDVDAHKVYSFKPRAPRHGPEAVARDLGGPPLLPGGLNLPVLNTRGADGLGEVEHPRGALAHGRVQGDGPLRAVLPQLVEVLGNHLHQQAAPPEGVLEQLGVGHVQAVVGARFDEGPAHLGAEEGDGLLVLAQLREGGQLEPRRHPTTGAEGEARIRFH
mmetsp:Transcript_30910/g.69438  ORF Transcript_30910/g.69438 Transcript_30910/m.69438 type:complete len:288 (-) Transcript_30910:253-1116(-)